ncbi:MAG: response regulator [Pseudomonadota bacterium]
MRILVAEDNLDNQEIIKRRLVRAGYEVSIAANGAEAVEFVAAQSPDLVLMDISMPIMSGIEATEAIRKTESDTHTPIIALTAHAMESDEARCLAVGCDAFATKPIRFAELLALIERILSEKSQSLKSA